MFRYWATTFAYTFTRAFWLNKCPLVTVSVFQSVVAGVMGPFTFPVLFTSDLANLERYLRGMPLVEHIKVPDL